MVLILGKIMLTKIIMITIFYHSLHSGSDPGEDHDNQDNHIHHTGYDPKEDHDDNGDNDHNDYQDNLDG